MLPPVIVALMYAGIAIGLAGLAYSVRRFVLEIRAARELVRLLATREEHRPLLHALLQRAQQHEGRLHISEHEAIDLRAYVQHALMHLPPADRKRVEQGLYAPFVDEREVYLRNLLSASVQRLQHQA
jgi:hypothetical protein